MVLEQYADIFVQKIDENRYAAHYCYNLQEKIEETINEEGNTIQKTVYECEAFGEILTSIKKSELISEYKRIGEMYDLPIVDKPKIVTLE